MIQAYKLTEDRLGVPAGSVVFAFRGNSYGCAADDSRATGKPHIAVTLKAYGGYPFITAPLDILEPHDPVLLPDVDVVHAKAVCKVGQGAECCKYLTVGAKGWSCEKLSPLNLTIEMRSDMTAAGDNCDGRASR